MEQNTITNTQLNSIYSDAVDITFNYDNLNLNFLSKEDGQFIYLGKVKLSPQTAKLFAKTLNDNIKKYESIYGKINVFDEKAKEKENSARKEYLETQNKKMDTEIERLEKMMEEKVARIKMLEEELNNDLF